MTVEQQALSGESVGRRKIRMLCTTCVHDTGTDGAGVSVLSTFGTSATVLTTDAVSAALDDLQLLLGVGPCLVATSSGTAVLVPDLADEEVQGDPRWPAYTGAAGQAGAGAVFAFPIYVGAVALGRIDLYRRLPGPLSAVQLRSGLRAADDIGRQMLDLTDSELPGAAEYPIAVHQAAGMVMVQLDTSIEVALSRLRARAFSEGLTMGDLADSVIAGRLRFTAEDR